MERYIIILLSFLIICFNSQAKTYKGIDVSHHQKQIDWEKVADDKVDFVYIKATEGATYTDPRFEENIKGANKAGLLVGVYHYFRMTSSAREQFKNFMSALDGLQSICFRW